MFRCTAQPQLRSSWKRPRNGAAAEAAFFEHCTAEALGLRTFVEPRDFNGHPRPVAPEAAPAGERTCAHAAGIKRRRRAARSGKDSLHESCRVVQSGTIARRPMSSHAARTACG